MKTEEMSQEIMNNLKLCCAEFNLTCDFELVNEFIPQGNFCNMEFIKLQSETNQAAIGVLDCHTGFMSILCTHLWRKELYWIKVGQSPVGPVIMIGTAIFKKIMDPIGEN